MINAIEFYEKRLNIIMKEGELPSELQGRFSYVLQILQMSRTSLVTRHLDFVQKGRKLTDLKTVIDKTSYNIYSVYQIILIQGISHIIIKTFSSFSIFILSDAPQCGRPHNNWLYRRQLDCLSDTIYVC